MFAIRGQRIPVAQVRALATGTDRFTLDPEAIARMNASRGIVDSIVARGEVVYGINTGFGKLSDVNIPADKLKNLQLNLVRSHCCGVGEPLEEAEVRAMLLLRANVLALGFSGARPAVAETLVAMLNAGICPVVPSKGSVGASGDLAPLAHLALGAIGEGDVTVNGVRKPAALALREAGIAPLELEAKEGLALLNGTQAILSVGSLALDRAIRLVDGFTCAGAASLEGVLGTDSAFDARIHEARPHQAQKDVAARLLELLAGSEIRESHRIGDRRVQDAYCLRCIPQVHGAALGALRHAASVLEIETGSATDNPLVFENGDVISGGNFHGAPLASALDYAAIAIADMMSISERRIDRLVNPDLNEGLPAFLAHHPGTGSGFMIAHVAAVSLLAEAKVLSHPASVDNLPTSGGKEDHVSMGMTAALKFRQIVALAEAVCAIEFIVAAEAVEYRRPLKSGPGLERALALVRQIVPRLDEDRVLSADIERLTVKLRDGLLG